LSPIPTLLPWLTRLQRFDALPGVNPQQAERALQSLTLLRKACGDDLAGLTHAATLQALSPSAHQALWRLATLYLVHASPTPQGDPVARFHLDNGARLERLNASANLSAKGLKQSAGLMVNYLYDLSRIETCHDRFVHGRVVHSRALSALL
jgi:malonyl-CoA decarboxylase